MFESGIEVTVAVEYCKSSLMRLESCSYLASFVATGSFETFAALY